MLPAVYLYEDLVNVEGVTVALVLSLQAAGINGTEFDTPQANRLAADDNATFSQEVFDIAVAKVEPAVEPDSTGNDIWRESVALIGVHLPILSISAS